MYSGMITIHLIYITLKVILFGLLFVILGGPVSHRPQ